MYQQDFSFNSFCTYFIPYAIATQMSYICIKETEKMEMTK